MLAWKPVSRADVSMETGFHAGIGLNAEWKNLLKTHLSLLHVCVAVKQWSQRNTLAELINIRKILIRTINCFPSTRLVLVLQLAICTEGDSCLWEEEPSKCGRQNKNRLGQLYNAPPPFPLLLLLLSFLAPTPFFSSSSSSSLSIRSQIYLPPASCCVCVRACVCVCVCTWTHLIEQRSPASFSFFCHPPPPRVF